MVTKSVRIAETASGGIITRWIVTKIKLFGIELFHCQVEQPPPDKPPASVAAATTTTTATGGVS